MLLCTEVTLVDGLTVRLVSSDSGLRAIEFEPWSPVQGSHPGAHRISSEAVRQLRAYFDGQLRRFDLPLDMRGTPFQLRVWRGLEPTPHREPGSDRRIAAAIGAPRAVRAVGAANGANPIPIVVPCHRVIGASGKLVGYEIGRA